jgi:hypothetical protein
MTTAEARRQLHMVLQGLTPEKVRTAREAVIVLHELRAEQRPFNAPTWEVVQALGTLRRLLIDLDQAQALVALNGAIPLSHDPERKAEGLREGESQWKLTYRASTQPCSQIPTTRGSIDSI